MNGVEEARSCDILFAEFYTSKLIGASRESIETLIGKGYHVKVYDENVSLARLQGANRAYIEREIPHIATLMCGSMEEVLAESEVIVIGNKAPKFASVPHQVRQDQVVIDLVRISKEIDHLDGRYDGICW